MSPEMAPAWPHLTLITPCMPSQNGLAPLSPLSFGSGCRFAAVVELEMALAGNPDKKLLMRALARRRDNQFDNFFERLSTELFITGTCFSSSL